MINIGSVLIRFWLQAGIRADGGPYSEVQEPYMPACEGLRQLIRIDSSTSIPRFIFVNNRLAGNGPATIEAVIL